LFCRQSANAGMWRVSDVPEPGDVAHAARDGEVFLTLGSTPTRWVTFEPTPLLEETIDRQ